MNPVEPECDKYPITRISFELIRYNRIKILQERQLKIIHGTNMFCVDKYDELCSKIQELREKLRSLGCSDKFINKYSQR